MAERHFGRDGRVAVVHNKRLWSGCTETGELHCNAAHCVTTWVVYTQLIMNAAVPIMHMARRPWSRHNELMRGFMT
jgi:hypothetical protein